MLCASHASQQIQKTFPFASTSSKIFDVKTHNGGSIKRALTADGSVCN